MCQAETGLPEVRVRSELERTWRQIEAFGALVEAGDYVDAIIDTADPDARPIPRPDVRRMLVPIGPVAVFGASNFPLAFSTAGGDTASALAAGCPVVVKGHPSHPGTSAVVAREVSAAVEKIGLPEGTFALLQASGVEVGEALVDEPAIAAVGFTGSLAGGRAIHDRAAARPRPIPVYAEMGSVNPIVVTEAALRARAGAIAEGLTASVATFGGQLCTKPGVVFVPAGAAGDAFIADVAARLEAADPQVMLNERLRDALVTRVGRARRAGRARGATAPAAAPRARASASPRPPTALPRPTSRASRGCSRSASARSCCCSATAPRTSCSTALDRVEGQLTGIAARRGRGRGARPTLVDVARRARGPARLRRLPDRRRSHPRHDARRPVPGDDRARHHVGRHDRDRALPAAGRVAERAGAAPAAGAARREPARDLAPGGRRADARADQPLTGWSAPKMLPSVSLK